MAPRYTGIHLITPLKNASPPSGPELIYIAIFSAKNQLKRPGHACDLTLLAGQTPTCKPPSSPTANPWLENTLTEPRKVPPTRSRKPRFSLVRNRTEAIGSQRLQLTTRQNLSHFGIYRCYRIGPCLALSLLFTAARTATGENGEISIFARDFGFGPFEQLARHEGSTALYGKYP